MNMKHIKIEITKEKVAVVTIDFKDSKVNKVSSELLDEIGGMLDKLNPDRNDRPCHRKRQGGQFRRRR